MASANSITSGPTSQPMELRAITDFRPAHFHLYPPAGLPPPYWPWSILRPAATLASTNLDSALPRILRCQFPSHHHHVSGEPTIPLGTYSTALGLSTLPIRTPNSTSIDPATPPTSECTYQCDGSSAAAHIRCCTTSTRSSPCIVTSFRASPPAVTAAAAATSVTA